jgi:threonine dehydrogenase-like Zn-dependent dehydrogenase
VLLVCSRESDRGRLYLTWSVVDGGFAEYCAYPAGKVFKIHNLSDVDATLLEPASCACHGLEKIAPKLGSTVLMFGAGPTGLCLAQLLKHNGGSHVVIAAPGGLKMDLAKKLEAADEYIELSRSNPEAQFQAIKDANPYGFDIVVEVCRVRRAYDETELTTPCRPPDPPRSLRTRSTTFVVVVSWWFTESTATLLE